jgi:hypothetical protein
MKQNVKRGYCTIFIRKVCRAEINTYIRNVIRFSFHTENKIKREAMIK